MELLVSTVKDVGDLDHSCLEPSPLYFSSSHEASVRCMMSVPSTCKSLLVQVRDDDGKILCDSGFVSLTSQEWSCLHAEAGCDGRPCARLLSYTEDYEHGWTLCLDMKERLGQASVLRHVHVIHHPRSSPSMVDSVVHDHASCQSNHNDSDDDRFDCTDAEASPMLNTRFKQLTTFGSFAPERPNKQQSLLQDMLSCTGKPFPKRLLQTSFWSSFSHGLTVISENRASENQAPPSLVAFEQVEQARSELQSSGYGSFTNVTWAERHISMQALSDTIDNLQSHGFPPVFIFMYEEAWSLWESLFDVMSQLLDDDYVELDASIFAWSLQPVGKNTKAIGNNFGQPHRDNSYDECHTSHEQDALFSQPDDALHMHPHQQMPWAHIRCLPASAGDVLFWKSNLIHWGTSCAANAASPPRKSLASAFMAGGSCKDSTISRSQLKAGLSLQQRLHLILRGLLIYEHWHPDFEGMDVLLQEPE